MEQVIRIACEYGALWRMRTSDTLLPNEYQLFQPNGAVAAKPFHGRAAGCGKFEHRSAPAASAQTSNRRSVWCMAELTIEPDFRQYAPALLIPLLLHEQRLPALVPVHPHVIASAVSLVNN
jgi:hypothetical protein